MTDKTEQKDVPADVTRMREMLGHTLQAWRDTIPQSLYEELERVATVPDEQEQGDDCVQPDIGTCPKHILAYRMDTGCPLCNMEGVGIGGQQIGQPADPKGGTNSPDVDWGPPGKKGYEPPPQASVPEDVPKNTLHTLAEITNIQTERINWLLAQKRRET